MILIRFAGGLGNQMFQYALGLYLARRNNTELVIDDTILYERDQAHEIVTHRDLDLDILNVDLRQASLKEIQQFNGTSYTHLSGKIMNKMIWELGKKRNLIVEKGRRFQPEIMLLPDNKCLVGAWQSEKYFKPVEAEIRRQFTFRKELIGKAANLADEILNCTSLCINVRRGDYVTSPVYSQMLGTMPLEYFTKALEYIRSQTRIDRIYIFSDDMAWCKEFLQFPELVTFVEHDLAGPKFSTYLNLMTLCTHFIIPNSSFGWWGAWLGKRPSKIVVAPLHWFKDTEQDSSDLVPDNWKRI
jgi:hypothetical protein